MKHKVSELEGALLDTAVAKAEGWPAGMEHFYPQKNSLLLGDFKPSVDWAHGGPIIERERLPLKFSDWANEWECSIPAPTPDCVDWRKFFYGPTPLVAAMRAFVASKFGDEVELP